MTIWLLRRWNVAAISVDSFLHLNSTPVLCGDTHSMLDANFIGLVTKPILHLLHDNHKISYQMKNSLTVNSRARNIFFFSAPKLVHLVKEATCLFFQWNIVFDFFKKKSFVFFHRFVFTMCVTLPFRCSHHFCRSTTLCIVLWWLLCCCCCCGSSHCSAVTLLFTFLYFTLFYSFFSFVCLCVKPIDSFKKRDICICWVHNTWIIGDRHKTNRQKIYK